MNKEEYDPNDCCKDVPLPTMIVLWCCAVIFALFTVATIYAFFMLFLDEIYKREANRKLLIRKETEKQLQHLERLERIKVLEEKTRNEKNEKECKELKGTQEPLLSIPIPPYNSYEYQ